MVRKNKSDRNNYNTTARTNPSNFVDEATNHIPRKIELIDLDKAVFERFNNKFQIKNKILELIKLDGEFTAKEVENHKSFDNIKGFIGMPYFTYTRLDSIKKTKSSPTNKTIIYSIQKQKENGIVIEDWIMPPPFRIELQYQFTFHTSYRSSSNEFTQQWINLFKNKRIILDVDGERFELRPDDYENMVRTSFEFGDDITKKLIYNHEMIIILEGILRLDDIVKKERVNKLRVDITEKCVRIDGPYDIYLNRT